MLILFLGKKQDMVVDEVMRSLLYPDFFPTHYELVTDDNAEGDETSEFIDIKGRKHRVIKVHISKLDEQREKDEEEQVNIFYWSILLELPFRITSPLPPVPFFSPGLNSFFSGDMIKILLK